MTLLALLALLVGCRCGGDAPAPEPAAEAPAEPAPPPPSGVQPEEVATIFEVVTTTSTAATGLRVRPDGQADLAVGTPGHLVWTSVNRLGEDELDTLRRELASDELAGVPDTLGAVPGAAPDAPAATYHLLTPNGPRTLEVPTRPDRRVAVLERMESLARGTASPPVSTRWTVLHRGAPTSFDVPCDPAKVPELKLVVEALLDRATPKADVTTDASPVRVEIVWGTGSAVWTTRLHDSGVLARGTEAGTVAGLRLREGVLGRVRKALDELEPAWVRCP